MICKEDVVNWFRDLKSYNRIDTMCVMLNMCLPFELRFLGTYLEELGRRDAPELRGAELKVNNPQEFIADIASGEPTDHRIRRKMALFLALYRACNHTYANELFKTLEGWGARTDLQRLFEEDDQQELLLVYIMATNHPLFSFEQRLHCSEIFTKLKSWDLKACQKHLERDDALLDQHHSHPQQNHQHGQHSHLQQQPQSQHHSMDSLHSNSPQQSPMQQQPHHQQHQTQPHHLQNSTPPPSVPPPGTIHALPPNATNSMQNLQQGSALGQPVTSYTGLPGITQTISNDALTTLHYLEALHPLPVQPDFTIPPPGPPTGNVSSRWVHCVYPQLAYPPPSSSPHMSNPSSPIQSRTTSPTRIHSSSVQHRISRNQQNDQQQQQQQNQSQLQSLKPVDEDQTLVMFSQMQLRNGMRQMHNTLPRQSKQSYVNQIPPYHHQQQHHSQRDGGGSSSYHSMNYNVKGGTGMMMDIMNHQPNSTGSDSGSSIGSTGDVSPPETPGVVSVSTTSIPHIRSNRSNNMRNVNGRLEKQLPSMTYSQLHQQHQQAVAQQQQQQQQQQFVGSDLMVTSAAQNFLTTGTTNGAAMSSTGNNGASGSGVVSGQVLLTQAAAAVAQQQGQFVYAGGPTSFAPVTTVSHRPVANTTLPHATAFRTPPVYAQAIQQQQTTEPVLYQYHPSAVVAAGAAGQAVVPNSTITFMSAPPQPSSTAASTQTSLPGAVRSSPSPQIGLLQQTKVPGSGVGVYGTTTLPYTGTAAPSCYNCGSLKHTGLDCPEASMEDMTRTSNFTLDYNTATSPGTVTTPTTNITIPTLTGGSLNTNNNTTTGAGIGGSSDLSSIAVNLATGESNTSSSSSSSTSNSSNGNKSNNSTTLSSNLISASSNSNSSTNNNNHHASTHGNSGSMSSSNSNSNNSSMDVPMTRSLSSTMLPADTSSTSSNNGTGGTSSGSNNSSNLVSASGK
ncbi:transcription factor mef2A [Anopheles nili]|uniref:transcription factor mef2A n=1 Tax=Anopheles nili TaxID=185578 RepID=UPI00237B798C|nr:transcription factor mef2A [Anopheles nili]